MKTWVPQPGEYIKEELEERGWTQSDLAYILGCPVQAVNMIIAGKRGISSEMAKSLGNAFDVSPELFANLQKAYDLSNAREPDPGIAKRARIQSKYPVREMIKRGWIEDTDAGMLEMQLAKFFEVKSIDDVPHLAHAARKSEYSDSITPEQCAWLFRVKIIARSFHAPKYSKNLLESAVGKLKTLLANPEDLRHIPRILMETGVRFVLVEALPGSKIDGVCFWLDDDSPVIGMSLRHDRIDNFCFSLRHEIEHVLQEHGKDQAIIDTEICEKAENSVEQNEQVANSAASSFCVPAARFDSFITRKSPFFSERDIVGFAQILQVHPGIVVGQLQKRTGRWELFRKYLVKVRHILMQASMVDGWGQVFPVSL